MAGAKNYLCVKENAYQIADLVLAEYKRYITTSRVTDVELKLKEIDKQLDDIVDTTWVTKKADMRIKSLMLPLCNFFGISMNELLSGERLDEKQYVENAEKNMR
mgnify:CR=1 FL=1